MADQDATTHDPEWDGIRPEIVRFAKSMERHLRAHELVRGDSWRDESERWLFERLCEEVGELRQAMYGTNPALNVAFEAVDVANFAMMIHQLKE